MINRNELKKKYPTEDGWNHNYFKTTKVLSFDQLCMTTGHKIRFLNIGHHESKPTEAIIVWKYKPNFEVGECVVYKNRMYTITEIRENGDLELYRTSQSSALGFELPDDFDEVYGLAKTKQIWDGAPSLFAVAKESDVHRLPSNNDNRSRF